MSHNPLTDWLRHRLALGGADLLRPITRSDLEAHQLRHLRETLTCAMKSRHYAERLRTPQLHASTPLGMLQSLPFTHPAELFSDPLAFMCAPPSEADRIVTLPTSGTTGAPKRIYFSEAELSATEHFFYFGMQNIAQGHSRVMVFMRGGTPDGFAVPGGVCDLLARALAARDCTAIAYGELHSDEAVAEAARALRKSGADCVVGTAAQMLRLARCAPQPAVKSVLLSADNIPAENVAELSKLWNCNVFRHYGMTETAFGGAVDCHAVASGSSVSGSTANDRAAQNHGMHIREPDMIFEIIDPETGAQIADGECGEIVLTTLTRRVMPLIRYRTGDFSRILPEKCPCGCILKRLDNVTGHA